MRKLSYICAAAFFLAAALIPTVPAMAAAKAQEVDTIVLENEVDDDEVAVDLGWKTMQDKGKWIEDMGIADGCSSLVLVINNIPEKKPEIPDADSLYNKVRISRREVTGNSRLFYFDKSESGYWSEVFSINCMLSGGSGEESDVYGAYRPYSSFGSLDNPGSLVSYRKLAADDYLILDEDSDAFATIVKKNKVSRKTPADKAVCLEDMKAYSNYGMILRAEQGSDSAPAIVLNCQQANVNDDTFESVQLSESYVRMLIQSIDANTRFLIAAEIEDLEGM